MSNFERLKDYLNHSSDYNEGVQILYALNQSDAIRSSLLQYPSPSKLQTYLNKQYEKLSSCPHIEESINEDSYSSGRLLSTTTTEYTEKTTLKNRLFKELAHYHSMMTPDISDDVCHSLMKKCVELDAELGYIHYELKHYAKQGKFPQRRSQPKPDKCDETQLQIRLKLSKMPQSIYADNQLIKKLNLQIQDTNIISEIEKINEKLHIAQARLEKKQIEKRRLETALTR